MKRLFVFISGLIVIGVLAEVLYLPRETKTRFSVNNEFTGNVRVSVIENLTGSNRYFQYDVLLDQGQIASLPLQRIKVLETRGLILTFAFRNQSQWNHQMGSTPLLAALHVKHQYQVVQKVLLSAQLEVREVNSNPMVFLTDSRCADWLGPQIHGR